MEFNIWGGERVLSKPVKNERKARAAILAARRRKARDYGWRHNTLHKLGFKHYRHYLASDLWASIRARVLKRDNHACRLCGKRAVQVHHNQYDLETLAGRDLSHLVSTCRGCHKRAEFDHKMRKRECADAAAQAEKRTARQDRVAEQHADLDRELDAILGL